MTPTVSVSVITLALPENPGIAPVRKQSLPGQADVDLFVVSQSRHLNSAVLQADSDWILIMQPNCQMASNLRDRLGWILSQHSKAAVLFPNDRVGAKIDETGFDLLRGLQPSGLLIKKSFLVEVGGLNETCGPSLEVEMFFRCLPNHKERMAFYSSHDLQLNEDSKTPIRLGIERVIQATQMCRNNVGMAPASWFKQYASAVDLVASDAANSKLTKDSARGHLAKVAARIDYWVALSDQAILGTFLNRSVFEGHAPDCAKEVDKIVKAAFPHIPLGPVSLPDDLNVFSIGTFGQAAQVLRQLALRRKKGPFDWISSNCDAVTHILEDDFNEFLNPEYLRQVSPEADPEVVATVTEHDFYRERFGVRYMFNRHNPLEDENRAKYFEAIENFKAAMASPSPSLLLYLARNESEYELIGDIVANLQERGENNVVLAVCFKQTPNYKSLPVKLHTTPDNMVYAAVLPVGSGSNDIEFAEEDDNIRLARLVHGVVLGRFGISAA